MILAAKMFLTLALIIIKKRTGDVGLKTGFKQDLKYIQLG